MAERRPLVLHNGRLAELPVGDSLPGVGFDPTAQPLIAWPTPAEILLEQQLADPQLLLEQVETVEIVEVAVQGPPGGGAAPARLITTHPLPVASGGALLPSSPEGDVVWNMALVYLDLTTADFDAGGALRADRNYLVEEHLVRTAGSSVIFTHAPPPDGCHAVVTYLPAP